MVIFINTHANNETGLKKWNKLQSCCPDIQQHSKQLHCIYDSKSYFSDINSRINKSSIVIAAGGDGTVHHLVQSIMQLKPQHRKKIILGAIGLGSSNDFHKPVNTISNKIPLKINYTEPLSHNIGECTITTASNKKLKRYFIINCSFGIVAHGNSQFNNGDSIINRLKHLWVNGSIYYTAIKSIFTYKNIAATIQIESESYKTLISNLGIGINPHFTGNLKYDTPITPQSNYLYVNLCEGMNTIQKIKALRSLSKGIFSSLPHTRSWLTKKVTVIPEINVPFEMDGEIILTKKVSIELIQGAIKVCQ